MRCFNLDILDLYIEKNSNEKWFKEFFSTSDKHSGKKFSFINTNFRSLYSFKTQFDKFKKINDKERKDWGKHPGHGQEVHKQHTVRMRSSKLFQEQNSIFSVTEKGKVFQKILDMNFSTSEEWILIYFMLLNSYFNFQPNYITLEVDNIIKSSKKANIETQDFSDSMKNALLNQPKDVFELFNMDVFWIFTFLNDEDFIYAFVNSNQNEKKDLINYVITNHSSNEYIDCVSRKYKPGGNYGFNTFMDELKITYFTRQIMIYNHKDFYDFTFSLLDEYSNIFNINVKNIYDFIMDNSDVFQAIYSDVFQLDSEDQYSYIVESNIEDKNINGPQEKIDDTTENNKSKIRKMSSILKRLAKERANYRCELEAMQDCRYFTSKENNQNYLEIHHLVPREFSNEFQHSIEIIDNYVALCPHCHKMLHYANDRERYSALKYLFNEREVKLKNKEINLSVNEIKSYYNVNNL